MLFRLRHPAVVGRDDEEGEIDRADAGNHVAHEGVVAGNIDNSNMQPVEIQFGEAKIDRHTARFLFAQTIGIGAGERLYYRPLPMIDVTGGCDDEIVHPFAVQTVRMASTTRSSWCGRIVRKSSLNERLAMYPITGGVWLRICAANWFAEQFSG